MSVFYDEASLVLVPSGYKASKVYAQKPLTTDGQLTFSRASTATRVNSAGLVETVSSNVPRLDYLGSSCPRLLLEPQRTNSSQYSEQLDNAYWLKFQATIAANNAASPDGYTNADKIQENTANDLHYISSGTGQMNASGTYTASVFLKASERSFAWLYIYNGVEAAGLTAYFNLSNGTLGTIDPAITATITDYGNGWYRCTATRTITGSASAGWGFGTATANGTNSYTGTAGSGILAYGVQLEAGAYATSYIPTLGAAVTRLADAASKTGISSLIGQTEGTIFLDFELKTPVNNDYVIGQIYNSSSAGDSVFIYITSANVVEAVVDNSGNQARIVSASALIQGNHKLAIAYKANDFVCYINGIQIGTDTSGTVPTCDSVKLIDYANGGGYMEKSAVNQYILFKTRLTNAQLAELTAL